MAVGYTSKYIVFPPVFRWGERLLEPSAAHGRVLGKPTRTSEVSSRVEVEIRVGQKYGVFWQS